MPNIFAYVCLLFFTAFQNLNELVSALKNRQDGLKGALVDTYVAGDVKEFSDKGLRVNKILDYSSYYGIVFGDGQMAENEFQKCLDNYVLLHKAEISKTVEEKTNPMKVRMLSIWFDVLHTYFTFNQAYFGHIHTRKREAKYGFRSLK